MPTTWHPASRTRSSNLFPSTWPSTSRAWPSKVTCWHPPCWHSWTTCGYFLDCNFSKGRDKLKCMGCRCLYLALPCRQCKSMAACLERSACLQSCFSLCSVSQMATCCRNPSCTQDTLQHLHSSTKAWVDPQADMSRHLHSKAWVDPQAAGRWHRHRHRQLQSHVFAS